MSVIGNLFIYLLLLILFHQSLTFVSEDMMLELYSKYKSAVSNDNFTEFTRRIFKKNREYEIHVTKLKEVNGFKKHNLFVKESLRTGERGSFIYINNPVESKIPKAYLTLEEFKSALSDRVLEQKNEFNIQRRKKEIALSYRNISRPHIYKTTTPETKYISKNQTIVNIPGKKNIQSLKSNTDITKYNEKENKNKTENKINNNKVLNKDKTIISANKVSATTNNVHKKNVTNTKKFFINNITSQLFTNTTEIYTNLETEITVSNLDINLDTTEAVTKNTGTEQTISDTQSIHFEETELFTDATDTSTVFENILKFKTTSSEIVTNIDNITNESVKIKMEPRWKKTTKSLSVPTKKKKVPLGRPLVFFGSR